MKGPWDPARLTVNFWDGPPPREKDECVTSTGRRYLILQVDFRGDPPVPRVLHCLVLPKDAPIEGHQYRWTWSSRPRKRS